MGYGRERYPETIGTAVVAKITRQGAVNQSVCFAKGSLRMNAKRERKMEIKLPPSKYRRKTPMRTRIPRSIWASK